MFFVNVLFLLFMGLHGSSAFYCLYVLAFRCRGTHGSVVSSTHGLSVWAFRNISVPSEQHTQHDSTGTEKPSRLILV